jgi:predicted RNase H-like HicB family nuclease
MNYVIVIEESDLGYSAYSPDVEGCIATGSTREEVVRAIRELIDLHLEWLQETGHQLPQSPSAAGRRVITA